MFMGAVWRRDDPGCSKVAEMKGMDFSESRKKNVEKKMFRIFFSELRFLIFSNFRGF